MSFSTKTWKDTIAEYPNRRVLTDATSGETQTVTVTRSVGTVSQEGDAWNAENMNDLETRIASSLADHDFTISTSWNANTTYGDYSTYPYYQSIASDLFTDESHPDCLVFGADPSAFMTSDEDSAKGLMCGEVSFSSSGIIVLAMSATETPLTLRVRGV